MTRILKTSFVWKFAAGFLIGATATLSMGINAAAPASPYTAAAYASQH